MDRVAYQEEAASIIAAQIELLRKMAFAEVAVLPEASGKDIMVGGQKASLTVFRQDNPHQLSGRILITVLVARERWFGMAAHHIERGLVFSPDEPTREATEIELQNSGG